jgi:hypothetical protein
MPAKRFFACSTVRCSAKSTGHRSGSAVRRI